VLAGSALVVAATPSHPGRQEPRPSQAIALLPWRWPTYRLVSFAVLNVAIAVGIALGFSPGLPG